MIESKYISKINKIKFKKNEKIKFYLDTINKINQNFNKSFDIKKNKLFIKNTKESIKKKKIKINSIKININVRENIDYLFKLLNQIIKKFNANKIFVKLKNFILKSKYLNRLFFDLNNKKVKKITLNEYYNLIGINRLKFKDSLISKELYNEIKNWINILEGNKKKKEIEEIKQLKIQYNKNIKNFKLLKEKNFNELSKLYNKDKYLFNKKLEGYKKINFIKPNELLNQNKDLGKEIKSFEFKYGNLENINNHNKLKLNIINKIMKEL